MDIVVLDMEWNGSYSRKKKGYINEIIEIGAVKCDENLKIIDNFACFVKPQVSKRISAIISDLTNITDENLTDGVNFMQAASKFKKWSADSLIMTWGTADILTLLENFRYFSAQDTIPFMQYYCDMQAYAESIIKSNSTEQVGLSTAAALFKVDTSKMELHRAYTDSVLAYKVLKKIYNEEKIKPFIFQCDDEFYRRITFKTAYISDLKNPQVKPSDLRFTCPKCSGHTDKTGSWVSRNKGFRAEFTCRHCGHRFIGRVIIKEKYEGITVNKKTLSIAKIEKPRQAVPQEIGNMALEIAENGVGLLKFKALAGDSVIKHAFSTRIGGVSRDQFAAMNLGFGRGDSESNVRKNYALFAQALGVEKASLVTGAQDHHINIRVVTEADAGKGIEKPYDMQSIDGLCTDNPGVTLVIYCADCVPLYFIDTKRHAIGLAHAGWKGTAAGMANAMAEKMQVAFGSKPENLTVAIGPSICKDCFEVDEPVAKIFQKLPNSDKFVEDKKNGKYHVDLWECNRQYLLAAGVPEGNIIIGGVCSMCNSDLVFSHRMTKGNRGSNAAMLCLEAKD